MRKLYILFALVFMFASCAKEGPVGPKGDTGAQGPQGIQGIQGPAGQNGMNGTNGTNGNANVKSTIITVASSDWAAIGTAGSVGRGIELYLNVPSLTQSIVDNGAVLVYRNVGSGYRALPFTDYGQTAGSNDWSVSWNYWTLLSKVQIVLYWSDFLNGVSPACTFKVVTIAASARMAHPNLDYNNYEAVKQAFNLED